MIKQNINFKKFIFYSFTLLLFIFILFQIKHISLAEDKTISKQNNKNIYIDNDLKQKHISYIYKKIDLDIDSINNDLENIDIPINTENNTNTLNDTQNISSSTNTTSSIKDNISNSDDDTNTNDINDDIKKENTEKNIEDNLNNEENENDIIETITDTNDTTNNDDKNEYIYENTEEEKPTSISNTVSSNVNNTNINKKEMVSNNNSTDNKVESSNKVVNSNSESSTRTVNTEENENKQVKDTVFYTDEYYNDYFYAKGKVREENMIAAQETLNKIPQYILDNFKKDGWIINIINEDIVYNGLNASGITTYADKTIDIKNNEGLIRSCIVHEVGHYFDCSLGFISESDEFLNNIYPEEKNNFNYTYTTSIKHEISDVYEYFASTFDEYIINPNGLKNDCPKTYEFMKNLIG